MSQEFDFLIIKIRQTKKDTMEVSPSFVVMKSKDIMIKGQSFYAIWLNDKGLWSTDQDDVTRNVDLMIDDTIKKQQKRNDEYGLYAKMIPKYMRDSDSGSVDKFNKYCHYQMTDHFHNLNNKIIFADTETKKEDYATFKLPYSMKESETPAFDKILSTLYSEKEAEKIMWAIGSIINGDSKKIQKMFVFYGAPGTGKSTILNIIQDLFDGYWVAFDARALGEANKDFALAPFKSFPLIGIQHDTDLSRIESNVKLNSLVSHEIMNINEKFKAEYPARIEAMLLVGTNNPVKITDLKSGLIRRIVDISPTGKLLGQNEYDRLTKKVKFELGGIAYKCLKFYEENKGLYRNYIPVKMIGATNDTYSFMVDRYDQLVSDGVASLNVLWKGYKEYCDDAKVNYPLSKRAFKNEMMEYFDEFQTVYKNPLTDKRERNMYLGFRSNKFEASLNVLRKEDEPKIDTWIDLKQQASKFNVMCYKCKAQKANDEGLPKYKWENVKTDLCDIDTNEVHYVKLDDIRHIVIDFDIKAPSGEKSFDLNLKAASEFPPTYVEVSKSGKGLHLHYIWTGGNPEELSRIYADNIEVKVFTGNSSLRRRLTLCNDLDIAELNSGLPRKKEVKSLFNKEGLQNEKALRTVIRRNLNKEYHGATKPSIDFIFKVLNDAYKGGLKYDVRDLRPAIMNFAACSTHNANYCLEKVLDMKFKSEDPSENLADDKKPLAFFDAEVFPNLFVVVWKIAGEQHKCVSMVNPTPSDIEEMCKFNLIGFNNRKYDNHILYARMLGYSNEALYTLSQRIVSNESKNSTFSEAYNLSYTDVYDFASAGNKMSLKKWEIKLGIHHQELGLPWDKPVEESMWDLVADYCCNDVIATEEVFNHLKGDFLARKILADLAGMTVNDTTNTLTTRIIFGENRRPQSEFNYRNLAEPVMELDKETKAFLKKVMPDMMKEKFVAGGLESYLPFFPGYKYEFGKSTYRGIDVGEGGEVYAEPGIHVNVALLDVMSMHPHSVIAEVLFGVRYTERFFELVYGRVDIKHEDWDEINNILDGKLTKYVEKVKSGELSSKALADALKTAINSVYGLTAARFENPFRDPRNIDNIVAKRGALFMIDLMNAVQEKGFTVAHIKTDSIKIPDATPEIIDFVMEFGKKYGYTFEHEATYKKMCLVNDAVYIAKYASVEDCMNRYSYVPSDNKKHKDDHGWTATGTQFAVPYVFKTLFSKEPIEFSDLCETKTVTTAMYLDMNEGLPEGEHKYRFVGRAGSFCPVTAEVGGGELVRDAGNGKYGAVVGTKGYRWLESEVVKGAELEKYIDRSYYDILVDKAVKEINKYGDFFD